MNRAICRRCGRPNPVITKSELATTPDMKMVREMQAICHKCRHNALRENAAADARRSGVTGVLELEHLWSLQLVVEDVCPECHHHWDTPNHFYGCEARSWPPT